MYLLLLMVLTGSEDSTACSCIKCSQLSSTMHRGRQCIWCQWFCRQL